MKFILVSISCCLLLSCTYMSERKRHLHIIDSLSKVEVPKYFDTLVFFQRALDRYLYETVTPQGVKIRQFHPSYLYAYRMEVRHVDSLFRHIYEYDEKGRIVEYFREFKENAGINAIGYIIEYDTLGNVSGYRRDIPPVPFDIYDIIDLLQKEKVNIVDSVYIGYRRDTKDQPYFWHVSVAYKKEDGEYSYMRHFDPQTGKILKEKTTKLLDYK